MRSDDPAVSSAGDPASIGELRIKVVTQGPLRRDGHERHSDQEEFERVMKTLRRAEPDVYEPSTPLIATRLKGDEIGDKVKAYEGSGLLVIEGPIEWVPDPVV